MHKCLYEIYHNQSLYNDNRNVEESLTKNYSFNDIENITSDWLLYYIFIKDKHIISY